MTPVAPNAELLTVASRIIWFEPPDEALADPVRFLAYLMTYGTIEDIEIGQRYFTETDFREALDHAPPGIIDPGSWAYWNLKAGRYPPPPLPVRRIPME